MLDFSAPHLTPPPGMSPLLASEVPPLQTFLLFSHLPSQSSSLALLSPLALKCWCSPVYTHSQVIIFGDPPLTTTSTPATPTSPSPAKASLLSSRPAILTTQNSGLLWDGPQRFIHMCRLETELFTLLHKPAPHPACPSSGAGATIQRHRQTTGNLEVNLNTVFPLIGL